jgi:D-arabinose 5-phosphate isomerase GutQ
MVKLGMTMVTLGEPAVFIQPAAADSSDCEKNE